MIRKKKRNYKGRYFCKLYQRAVNAEMKMKMVTDAHDRCIQIREYKINELGAELEQMIKINGVMLRMLGGSAELKLLDIQNESVNGSYIEAIDNDTIRIVHVPDKDAD